MTFRPDPKPERIKLSQKEYTELRRKVYDKQFGDCLGCGFWFPRECFSLHHIKSKGAGGDDTEENTDGYCVGCHPD